MNMTKRTKRIIGFTIITMTALFFIMMVWFLLYFVTMSAVIAMEGGMPTLGWTILKFGITYWGIIGVVLVLVTSFKVVRRHYNLNVESSQQ